MEFSKLEMKLSNLFQLKIRLNFIPTGIDDNPDLTINSPITLENEDLFLNIILPKTAEYDKFRSVFGIIGLEERLLYTIFRKKIEDIELYNLIKKLCDISGLNVAYTTIENGYLVITGFMHDNATGAFSDILYEFTGKNHLISKINLRPTEGFLQYSVQNYPNLKSLAISLPMTVFGHYRVVDALKNTGSVAQFKNNYPIDGKFMIIIYSDREIRNVDGLKVISKEDHIYETLTDEDIFIKLTNTAMNKNITWNFLFMYADEEKLYMNFILPDLRIREYFSLVIDLEMELKHLDWVTLEHYGDINTTDSGDIILTR